jgi:NADPH2:quinone reductase
VPAAVFERFGEPTEVLTVRDVPSPTPQAGEVLVRMLASPVNPSDLMTIRGIYGKRPELPATPGYEGVGIVEESQAGLYGGWLKGQRVAVMNQNGGNWQTRVTVSAKSVIPLPKSLPVEQAATFFVNPAAAYLMTRHVFKLSPGDWLVQTAAGSALGKMVIRLGRQFGFKTANIVRRGEQAAELTDCGADAVVVFDPTRQTEDELRSALGSHLGASGVRYAIDPVGGATGSAVINCLGSGGRLLVYGTLSPEPLTFSSRSLMTVGASVEGFWLSRVMEGMSFLGKLGLIRQLTDLIQRGVLHSDIGQEFPLEAVRDAVRAAELPGKSGKVLLRIDAA